MNPLIQALMLHYYGGHAAPPAVAESYRAKPVPQVTSPGPWWIPRDWWDEQLALSHQDIRDIQQLNPYYVPGQRASSNVEDRRGEDYWARLARRLGSEPVPPPVDPATSAGQNLLAGPPDDYSAARQSAAQDAYERVVRLERVRRGLHPTPNQLATPDFRFSQVP